MIDNVLNNPALPVYWGKNQKGMQALEELPDSAKAEAQKTWLEAMGAAAHYAERLRIIGLHKQVANRILEPFQHITVILSGTRFANWFRLRAHSAAQPEICVLAETMKDLYQRNKPQTIRPGEWHIPMILPDESLPTDVSLRVATARVARVSYLTHDGKRDYEDDLRLHDDLVREHHMSPFEHCAMAWDSERAFGNFQGWKQYRKFFEGDEDEGDIYYPEATS